MPIRKFKPTSPSRRFYEAPDFDQITAKKPEKKLPEVHKVGKFWRRRTAG